MGNSLQGNRWSRSAPWLTARQHRIGMREHILEHLESLPQAHTDRHTAPWARLFMPGPAKRRAPSMA